LESRIILFHVGGPVKEIEDCKRERSSSVSSHPTVCLESNDSKS
jgi:hypothetical protein